MSSPSLLRLDAHQHFWRYRAADYPWIGVPEAGLRRDFIPQDLKPLLDAAGLDGCIAVQARAGEQETNALLEMARQHPWIFGVVGWVDLCDPALEQHLHQWRDQPPLKGFRHQIQDEPRPATFMADPAFSRGLQQLQQQGYVYEVLIRCADLSAATALCQCHDQHHLVLDHLGKPDIAKGPGAWADHLAPLAALPHVSCKLSGLLTEAGPGQRNAQTLRPFIELALELFGAERLMFGSDWPVCLLAGEYEGTCQLLEQTLDQLSPSEHQAIWGGTAQRVYQLEGNCP